MGTLNLRGERHFKGESKREQDRETERQRDRETERQRDRETERQRDRETDRQTDRAFVLNKCLPLAFAMQIVRRVVAVVGSGATLTTTGLTTPLQPYPCCSD